MLLLLDTCVTTFHYHTGVCLKERRCFSWTGWKQKAERTDLPRQFPCFQLSPLISSEYFTWRVPVLKRDDTKNGVWSLGSVPLSMGKRPKNSKTSCSKWDTFKQKHTDTQSLIPVANSLQQSSYHIPLANSLNPLKKAVLCKAAVLRFFRSAYHPHSIDQGFRYLRNDCLQCGGLSFPMPIDDLCPSLNKYIYPDTRIPHHAPYSIKAMS